MRSERLCLVSDCSSLFLSFPSLLPSFPSLSSLFLPPSPLFLSPSSHRKCHNLIRDMPLKQAIPRKPSDTFQVQCVWLPTMSESRLHVCHSRLPFSDGISLPTSKQQQISTAEGLQVSHTLQASPIRPRKFGIGPARGLMKGKDTDKPVLHLHWLVRWRD